MKRSGHVPAPASPSLPNPAGRGAARSALLSAVTVVLLGAAACSEPQTEAPDGGMSGSDLSTAPTPGIVINEIFPHGADELTDPDWVELKNTGDTAVDLSGYRLRDDTTTMTLPAGTTVAAGQYLIIYCDDAPDGGATDRLHAPFKLGKQDELYLLRPDGNKADGLTWDAIAVPTGKSYGRLPDGTGQFNAITPSQNKRNGT